MAIIDNPNAPVFRYEILFNDGKEREVAATNVSGRPSQGPTSDVVFLRNNVEVARYKSSVIIGWLRKSIKEER